MNLYDKLKAGLAKTSRNILGVLQGAFGAGKITEETLDMLEEALIQADVGVQAAHFFRERVKEESQRAGPATEKEFLTLLERLVKEVLDAVVEPLCVAETGPTVYVVVGVNGSGKTTTAGKLAQRWRNEGKTVILAAGDTFRAAAADQLAIWAKRSSATLIAHQEGSDPGAVAYDAVRAAVARETDLVLVDTAGRIHTKKNLMEELKKIVRVVSRELPGAPHEILLVLDGTTGQNGLSQARMFTDAVGVTGICLTKLDGSSKGGIAVAIAQDLGIPVKLVGVGEGSGDLLDFDPAAFSAGLFETPDP